MHCAGVYDLSQDVLPHQGRRQTRIPNHLQTDMTEPINQGRSEEVKLSEFMHNEIYFPIIDIALVELGRRFSPKNIAILGAVCALLLG